MTDTLPLFTFERFSLKCEALEVKLVAKKQKDGSTAEAWENVFCGKKAWVCYKGNHPLCPDCLDVVLRFPEHAAAYQKAEVEVEAKKAVQHAA